MWLENAQTLNVSNPNKNGKRRSWLYSTSFIWITYQYHILLQHSFKTAFSYCWSSSFITIEMYLSSVFLIYAVRWRCIFFVFCWNVIVIKIIIDADLLNILCILMGVMDAIYNTSVSQRTNYMKILSSRCFSNSQYLKWQITGYFRVPIEVMFANFMSCIPKGKLSEVMRFTLSTKNVWFHCSLIGVAMFRHVTWWYFTQNIEDVKAGLHLTFAFSFDLCCPILDNWDVKYKHHHLKLLPYNPFLTFDIECKPALTNDPDNITL